MNQRYMNHPKHGRIPVYSNAEIDRNSKNGWILETLEEKPNDPMPKEVVPPDHLVAEVLEIEPPGKACPACGKTFQRGLTMHMKYCKGIQ